MKRKLLSSLHIASTLVLMLFATTFAPLAATVYAANTPLPANGVKSLDYTGGKWKLSLEKAEAWEIKLIDPVPQEVVCSGNLHTPPVPECEGKVFTFSSQASCIKVQVDWKSGSGYNSSDPEACKQGNGGNLNCPVGTTQLAKYNWQGNSYVAESGGGIVSVSGTTQSGTFTVASGYEVSAVVVKGANDAKIDPYNPAVTSGSFDNSGLENGGGETPAISNLKFCGQEKEQPPYTCPVGTIWKDKNHNGQVEEGECKTPKPPKTCPEGKIWVDADQDGKVDRGECHTPPPAEPAAPAVQAAASACVNPGESTGVINFTVTNTDDDTDDTVTYTITLSGGATQQVTVADGQTGSGQFTGLVADGYTVSVSGDDDTTANTAVTVEECDVTPPPAKTCPAGTAWIDQNQNQMVDEGECDVCPNLPNVQTAIPDNYGVMLVDGTNYCYGLEERGGGGEDEPDAPAVLGIAPSDTLPTPTPELADTGDSTILVMLFSLAVIAIAIGAAFSTRQYGAAIGVTSAGAMTMAAPIVLKRPQVFAAIEASIRTQLIAAAWMLTIAKHRY